MIAYNIVQKIVFALREIGESTPVWWRGPEKLVEEVADMTGIRIDEVDTVVIGFCDSHLAMVLRDCGMRIGKAVVTFNQRVKPGPGVTLGGWS